MPVERVLSKDLLALGIRYLFDWDQKTWVKHPEVYPFYDGTWHSQFLCREVNGRSQFWFLVEPATAKLMVQFGLRDSHLLQAIGGSPSDKIVMFYLDGQIAAALVERPPEKSHPPKWWYEPPPPTRFEREDVI